MKILKIITGIVLLIVAIILTLAIIVSFFNSLPQIRSELAQSKSGGIAYLLGSLVVVVGAGFLSYYAAKKGVQLLNPKAALVDSIDDIGS